MELCERVYGPKLANRRENNHCDAHAFSQMLAWVCVIMRVCKQIACLHCLRMYTHVYSCLTSCMLNTRCCSLENVVELRVSMRRGVSLPDAIQRCPVLSC